MTSVADPILSAGRGPRPGLRRLAFVSLALALTACGGDEVRSFGGPTMGSTYRVQYVSGSQAPERLQAGVQGILDALDRAVSTYRPDSDVARFNAAPAGSCSPMPESVFRLFDYAQTLHRESGGAYDITLLPALSAWGFGPRGRVSEHPSAAQLDALRSVVGMEHVRAETAPDGARILCKDAAASIEFNSIAAGFAVDRITEYLRAQGVASFLIDVTGELRADGRKPDGSAWRIALEAPISNARVAERIVPLESLGVSTSGSYRNYYEENGVRYSHTLDPRTLSPVTHKLASVSVISETALEADGLSTLLMALGPEQGYDFAVRYNLAAFFVVKTDAKVEETDSRAFTVRSTPAFEARFPALKGTS